MSPNSDPPSRAPIPEIGVAAARKVRAEIGYEHPGELEIEVIAYMRGAVVRRRPASGSRANLVRLGDRGIIAVADGLTPEERRWAIAHELGHFEAHPHVSFLGLCSGEDMRASYRASGREPEANAFAAELLMPEDLVARHGAVAKVSWDPIVKMAKSFGVSMSAAAIRFAGITDERVAIVCSKDGVIEWVSASRDFGPKPARGKKVEEWTEARAFFESGTISETPQTVSASAWLEDADDDVHLVEHLLARPGQNVALSLLWFPPT